VVSFMNFNDTSLHVVTHKFVKSAGTNVQVGWWSNMQPHESHQFQLGLGYSRAESKE
jgi:hypothetical protein